jgi:hypothetical protein
MRGETNFRGIDHNLRQHSGLAWQLCDTPRAKAMVAKGCGSLPKGRRQALAEFKSSKSLFATATLMWYALDAGS